jgi:hypothetical protein
VKGAWVVAAAIVALGGALLGAWINSSLTTRRQEWELRQSLSSTLLESLSEAEEGLKLTVSMEDQISLAAQEGQPTDKLKAMQRRYHRRASEAFAVVNRTLPMAAVVLSKNSRQMLEQMMEMVQRAGDSPTVYGKLAAGYVLVRRAKELLIVEAKKELGM